MKTLKEIVAERDPEDILEDEMRSVKYCPFAYYYLGKYLKEDELKGECPEENISCWECWNREVEEEPVEEVSDVLYPTTRNLQLRLCNTHIVPMSKKACEESAEVLEAAVMYQLEPTEENAHALAQENIDAIQMHLNMLNCLEKQGVITIPLEIKDHNRKIYLRGWEVDTSLKLEAKEG